MIESPIHTVIRAYDTTRHALHSIENHVDSTLVSGYTYQVNEIGQRTAVTTDGDVFGSHPADWTWGYDARGQVGSAKHEGDGGFSCFYDYDHMGNRKESRIGTHTAAGGEVTAYDRNNLNQYIEIDPPAEDAFVPGYDDDGNLTGGPLPVAKDQLNTLDWDGRNQLIRVYQGTGEGKVPLAAYTYDAYGRRVVKTNAQGSQRDYFLYDGWNLVAEYRGAVHNGGSPPALTLRRTWSWGLDLSATLQGAGGVGGMLAMRNTDGNIYYPAYDGNGNVCQYLDANGDPAAHMEYDAFGNIVTLDSIQEYFPHTFSTKPLDPTTGLYYYGYRWYDPLTGRWPSRDPIGEDGGLNLYGFVRNCAVGKLDTLGKIEAPPEHGQTSLNIVVKCKCWQKWETCCFQPGNWNKKEYGVLVAEGEGEAILPEIDGSLVEQMPNAWLAKWPVLAIATKHRAEDAAKDSLAADFVRRAGAFRSSSCFIEMDPQPIVRCSCSIFSQEFSFRGVFGGNEWWLPSGPEGRIGSFEEVVAELIEDAERIAAWNRIVEDGM